ncbi:pleckstrin homology domain-containing family F member 1-like [Menidia menidia]|uniref:(Atlantic silverside) hypothetical protein n=1 Tax=Menidia menidia TaxID=238744 RepID=A0A8S4ASQ4_9TELE|nr:unnamed protein product [Menidia menidia]
MEQQAFDRENRKRIQAVQNAFGPSGETLCCPGRILFGEGVLMKQGRKKWQPKGFFLFNDILVYGSVLVRGRWYNNQKIILLEDVKQEDMEDGDDVKNQWLICTASKSFFVSAGSSEEKQAWMEHIEDCRRLLLQAGGRQPRSTFAVSWIPDRAAQKCLRCLGKFTGTKRRHHCRKCGFVVCSGCSQQRGVIHNIHPTKLQRICYRCHQLMRQEEQPDSAGENDNGGESGDGDKLQRYTPSSWLDTRRGTWAHVGPHQTVPE